jgi:periplasmic divalent cation tolerance protein
MTNKILVHTTCSSMEEAQKIAARLVELRLAACVSIVPGVRSTYRWQGKVEESEEVGLTCKSRRDLFPVLCAELRGLHSYEVPEILATPVVDGERSYLEWLAQELRAEQDETA